MQIICYLQAVQLKSTWNFSSQQHPTLTVSSFSYNGSGTSSYDATILDIDKQATDTVTVLVTGAPAVAAIRRNFNVGMNSYIGAPAESLACGCLIHQLVDNSGNPYQIKLLLPPGYDGSGVMILLLFS